MRFRTLQTLYEAKPRVLIGAEVLLGFGWMLWSLWAGLWTVWRRDAPP